MKEMGSEVHGAPDAGRRGCSFIAVVAAVCACLLWLSPPLSAQVPKLSDIPSNLAEAKRSSLSTQRAGLDQRRGDLIRRVSAHNSQCGLVPENSPRYGSCAAEQSALETDKNKYIADVNEFNRQVALAATLAANPSSNVVDLSDKKGPLVVNPRDLKPPVREGGPIEIPPAERIAELQKRIDVLQKALVQLGKARQNPAERKEWEEAIGEASHDLLRDTLKLQTDLISEYTAGRLDKGLEEINTRIQNQVVRLSGETDPARRALLHESIKTMNEQRNDLKSIVGKLQKANDAGLVVDTAEWAAQKGEPLRKSVEGVQSLMQIALDEKKVQQWMKVAPGYGQALKFGSDTVNVAYDLTKGLVSASRLKEFNTQDELYAQRVNELSARMQSSMRELKSLEAQMKTQPK